MRRILFLSLGVLEFLVALVLVGFAWQLPGPAEVQSHVVRVERVGKETTRQLSQIRSHVHALQERRPALHDMAVRLQEEMRRVTETLRNQQVDYGTVRNVSDALGDVARGLDGLGDTLDPEGVARVGTGLKAMADYLEEQVVPAASDMARQLEKASAELEADAKRLGALLRAAPVDLKAAREIHDSLGRFGDGLERLDGLLKLQRGEAMRDGFKGLEGSLTTGAEQVERLAGYTYPAVRFEGLKPVVEQKQFWPEGEKIAEGMRKASKGATAAGEELDQLRSDLPKLREALAESRKVANSTRNAISTALKQQDKLESLLKNVPEHAANLAEQLPRLASSLARILRDTGRMKEIAILLRQTQKGIDGVVARWPELRKNFSRSAVLLRTTRDQLKYVLEHRTEYEDSLQNTLSMSKAVSGTLPLLTEQLGQDLDEQEQSLTSLSNSVQEVADAMPGAGRTVTSLLQTTRFLFGLLAVVFALHGVSLALGAKWTGIGH